MEEEKQVCVQTYDTTITVRSYETDNLEKIRKIISPPFKKTHPYTTLPFSFHNLFYPSPLPMDANKTYPSFLKKGGSKPCIVRNVN